MGIQDTARVATQLARLGTVDYLSITLGTRGGYVKDVTTPDAPTARAARIIRDASGLPIIVGQRINTPEVAERLLAVMRHLETDEYFLATYGDGLTDAPLPDMIERLRSSGKTGLFISVRPMFNAHVVHSDADGVVRSIEDMQRADVWINGGFMVLRRDILDDINPGEELVVEPFTRLIERGELIAYRYEGFWEPMDTIKDKQRLDALAESGNAPWGRAGIDSVTTG
jgi:NDP-sugar pyrophosphorylase family protein